MKQTAIWRLLLACVLVLGAASLYAQEPEYRLVIRDHKFEPAELTIPAGKKVKLIIENMDAVVLV